MAELKQELGYFDLSRLKVCLDQMLKVTPDSFKQCVGNLESGSNIELYKTLMFKALLYLFRKEYISGMSEEN